MPPPPCQHGCGIDNPLFECLFTNDAGWCRCFSAAGRTYCSPACRDAGVALNPAKEPA